MNNDTIIFIGMDTHKEFTEIAYSEYQRESSDLLNRHPTHSHSLTSI